MSIEVKNFHSLQILNFDKKSFTIKLSTSNNKMEILVSNDCILLLSYKLSFDLENFHKLNKFFRQFDSVEEIFEFIVGLEDLEKKITIIAEEKFIKLKLELPFISKGLNSNNIELIIPSVEVKESDLVAKLCEKSEKLSIIELKLKYILSCIGKTEEDFDIYAEIRFHVNKNIKKIESKIINIEDFIVPSIGIKKNLNKIIKEVNLLYRASRDGDSTQFHNKCNGKINTITFVKSKNERKFGGFASMGWHSNNAYISDKNAFIFSLDFNECYYPKNGNNTIYGSSSYGPLWGQGNHDLYLASGCLSNNSSATYQTDYYNYNGKMFVLSGGNNFQAEDYETYECIFE